LGQGRQRPVMPLSAPSTMTLSGRPSIWALMIS